MKAIVADRPGSPEVLDYREVPLPKISEGWSLVKVMGAGVNHSEVFTRQGLSPGVEFPRILGIECVGMIFETSDPAAFSPGQKVLSIMGEMGRAFDGGYAEYVLLPNDQIYPFESDLTWDILAAIPETGYTAFGSMQAMHIRPSDRILVRGATSGVGVTFCKMIKSKYPDAFIAGSSRSINKKALLTSAGFNDIVIDEDGILNTDEKYDKVLELIGPATLKDTFLHVKNGGIVCSTGQLGGQWTMESFDPIFDIPNGAYLSGFYSGDVDGVRLQEMLDYVKNNKVDMSPEKVFALKDAASAHKYIESAHGLGKVVLITEHEEASSFEFSKNAAR